MKNWPFDEAASRSLVNDSNSLRTISDNITIQEADRPPFEIFDESLSLVPLDFRQSNYDGSEPF
jgi:hypothetical protein